MPPFFLSTDQFIHGIIMANYTSGAPVRGNLTLKATVRPIGPIDPNKYNNRLRPRPMNYEQNNYNPGNIGYETYGPDLNRQNENDRYGSYNKPIIERYFNFDEHLPFWFKVPEYYYEPVPHLKQVSQYHINIT